MVFKSNFWLNLHNFLNKEAKRRARINDEGAGARGNLNADTMGLRPLESAERVVWDAAVDFYARNSLHGRIGGGDSLVIRINDRLASVDEEGLPEAAGVDSAFATELARAAPIYRAAWWPIHDRRNQAWIAGSRQLLARYGGCVFPRMQQTLAQRWPSGVIQVHATIYASWFGAYSTRATGPRVTMSTNAVGNLETYALEGILHEAGHAAGLLKAVDSSLAAARATSNVAVASELGHAILFYTAGELVREVIPAHVPYAERFGLWSQNAGAEKIKRALGVDWQAYLDGRTAFGPALDAILRRLREGS